MIMYADDTTLYSTCFCYLPFQKLKKVADWQKLNKLAIYVKKYKFMLITCLKTR